MNDLLTISTFATLLAMTNLAWAQPNGADPDLKLAYVLATASFCAYTVGARRNDKRRREIDSAMCLRGAARESGLLGELNVADEDVEVFVSRDGKDAYLLIRSKTNLILRIAPSGV